MADGERTVTAKGNIEDSNVVTGDENVVEGDGHLGDNVAGDKNVFEAPAPIVTALHQLPSPPTDFTGREKELEELRTAIEKGAKTGGVTISGLQGLGGVGKTALALKLADEIKSSYPDAQFYLDLKGHEKHPMSVIEALSHVIRAYHPTAKLPDNEIDLRGLYQTALNGQRALLLMDNAANAAQVEPLIPPAGCVLLVTSRQHFALPGLFAKDLNSLPAEDSHKLLLAIAPRIGNKAATIAELCGYLPLALRLAASTLQLDPIFPLKFICADYLIRNNT